MNAEDIVVQLIALHGGELVGRTRLQKQAYLLHCCGGNFGLSFVYHHYGPYSFDLVDGLTDARAGERIETEERPGRYGVPYAIFKLKRDESSEQLGDLPATRVRPLIQRMENVSDIVLELAATIVFLREEAGYPGDRAIEETKARKPLKATEQRIDRALSLLADLGLRAKRLPMP